MYFPYSFLYTISMKNMTSLPADLDLLAALGGDLTDTTSSVPDTAIGISKETDSIRDTSLGGTGKTGVTSSLEEKALSLLGAGVHAEAVASALGVTPARISQLLSNEVFSKKVAALKYESLQKHNVRDAHYDSIEDKLLAKLEKSLPLMVKPESILKAISIVNGAKRRGSDKPAVVSNQQTIVNLVLPEVISNKFAIDLNNQVIKAGEQELLTMPSGDLLKRVEVKQQEREEEIKRLGGNDL